MCKYSCFCIECIETYLSRVFIIDVVSGDGMIRLGCVCVCVWGGGLLWRIYAAMHCHLLLKTVVLCHKYNFLYL
jgi:hypothetical protein